MASHCPFCLISPSSISRESTSCCSCAEDSSSKHALRKRKQPWSTSCVPWTSYEADLGQNLFFSLTSSSPSVTEGPHGCSWESGLAKEGHPLCPVSGTPWEQCPHKSPQAPGERGRTATILHGRSGALRSSAHCGVQVIQRLRLGCWMMYSVLPFLWLKQASCPSRPPQVCGFVRPWWSPVRFGDSGSVNSHQLFLEARPF